MGQDSQEIESENLENPIENIRASPKLLRDKHAVLKSTARAQVNRDLIVGLREEVAKIIQTSDPVLGAPSAKLACCSLERLQPTLFLHGYPYKAVTQLMLRASEIAHNGFVDAEKFENVLSSFKREQARRAEPPSGLGNGIHILVLRAGAASSILPVLHVLQERVFPRLVQTAMQVGGFCRFEHLSLCSDEGSDGLEKEFCYKEFCYDDMRMTTEQCLEYAATCASKSAHVWFLFVVDEWVAASVVPARVQDAEMQHLINLTTNARDPGNFLTKLQTAYTKDTDSDAYVLKSTKSVARAIHRLQNSMKTFAYMPTPSADPQTSLGVSGEGSSEEHALRQAVLEFLQPSTVFTCLTQAAAVWPIFVIFLSKMTKSANTSCETQRLETGSL